jgi:hypothetical protein
MGVSEDFKNPPATKAGGGVEHELAANLSVPPTWST